MTVMGPMHDEEEQPAEACGPMSWKETAEVVAVLLTIPLILATLVATAVRVARYSQDEPARYSVELVGASGIGRPAPLAPGAAAAPPALELLVRLDNGHVVDIDCGCGDVVVSYAGVPLARGRVPALYVEAKKAATVAVDATSGGVGVPEDLFRLMSEERRRSGVARLEVDLMFKHGFYTCDVELHGERSASECENQNIIYHVWA